MFVKHTAQNVKGFTLIEVLMVIVVIGLMVAAVQINFFANKPQEQLNQEANRFTAIFNLAADYGLLNNIEIGLFVEQHAYQFVGYDGTRWTPIPSEKALERYELPEHIVITLTFDGLTPEESSLIDPELFEIDDERLQEMQDGQKDEQFIIPQVYLLSGGEITPFIATFSIDENEQGTTPVTVVGQYTAPVSVVDLANMQAVR